MRLAYCYPEALPSKTARSIQVVNTCFALAGELEELILYVPQGVYAGGEIFSYYGLEKPSNLKISFIRKSLGPITSHKFYNYFLGVSLKKDQPDILFSRHLQTADFLLNHSAPLIYESHEIFSEKKNASTRDNLLEKKVMANASGVVFISQGLRRVMAEHYIITENQEIIPSSAKRIELFAEKQIKPENVNTFVYVGTTRYGWKGVDVLIDAVELLPEKYVLEIVGELDEKFSRQKKVVQLIEQGRLISRGYLQASEVFSFMRKTKVAVIPNSARDRISALFTSPLKLIEAISAGVAVVVSDLPSMREIVSENEAVFVQPDNPFSLAAGVRKLFEDDSLRNKLAENGWKRSREYSWQSRAQKIADLAQKILGKFPS
ncbi:MAG: hypothetical protein BM485_07830 [Desulfobulbaceae bacterium DB1]|nr:MAG: hypothetical protein BM485_07830 [Desulfobulbaceae bacterium DB1]